MSTTAPVSLPEPLRSVVEYPLRRGKLVLALQGTTPAWVEPTLKKLGEILRLPPNWDSYGARPIDLACAWAVWPLLSAIMRDDSPPPAVIPMSRGHIQLEWHAAGIDLEIEVIDARHFRVSFEDAPAGEAWEKDIEDDLGELIDAVARLSLRDAR